MLSFRLIFPEQDIAVNHFGAFHKNFRAIDSRFVDLNNPVVKTMIEVEAGVITEMENLLDEEIERSLKKEQYERALSYCDKLEAIGSVRGRIIRAGILVSAEENHYFFQGINEVATAILQSKDVKHLAVLLGILERGCRSSIIEANEGCACIHDKELLLEELRSYLTIGNPSFRRHEAGRLLSVVRSYMKMELMNTSSEEAKSN